MKQKIPFFDKKSQLPEIESLPEILASPLPEPAPPKTHLFSSKSCCSTPKIVTVAGSVFLLLTIFATTVQLIFPTGMVIYQASGITFTLPSLLSGLGIIASLVTLAAGSILWHRSRKATSITQDSPLN